MELSKIITNCFVDNLTADQLKSFIEKVLIPQKANTLLAHALEAQKILNNPQTPKTPKNKKNKDLVSN